MTADSSTPQSTVTLSQYLFTRLYQLGVKSLHGVPGDYNLTALDYVEKSGLRWVSNCNELNAAYAADGYGRIAGLGALITAFGVGELSALNGVAGSRTERTPVVHIVGTPRTSAQKSHLNLHHSFGNGDFRVFAEIHAKVTVAQANLAEGDAEEKCQAIDAVLREAIVKRGPVYVELPTDVVEIEVDTSRLETPIDVSDPKPNPAFQAHEVDQILQRLYSAEKPILIVDGFVRNFGAVEEVNEFARISGLPTFTTPFGKSIINEKLPNFHGVYSGPLGPEITQSYVESSDFVLRFGVLDGDVNTMGRILQYPAEVTVDINGDHVSTFGGQKTSNLYMKGLLQEILRQVDTSRITRPVLTPPPEAHLLPSDVSDDNALVTHAKLWPRITSWLRPHDIVFTEAGTASSGFRATQCSTDLHLINSPIWMSIGYSLPAAQGASLAARDIASLDSKLGSRRTVLFQGDGSFQMTAQELSTVMRNQLDMTFFLINNDGYTIERLLHGFDEYYNDIARWRYSQAPSFFGGEDGKNYKMFIVKMWGELEALLCDEEFNVGKGLNFVELHMPREDAPECLRALADLVAKWNARPSEQANSAAA